VSFLARIAMRAGIPGGGTEPLLVPKDRGLQRPPNLARQEIEPEEDQAQTLRRQPETEIEEAEVQTLRRQLEGEDEEAAPAPIVPPASQEEEPEVRAAGTGAADMPDEEQMQPARRLARMAEDGEELHAIRRMAATEEDEESAEAARPLRRSFVVRRSVQRAPAPVPSELGPKTSPPPKIVSDEPEPSNLRALGEPMPAAAPPPGPVPTGDRPDRSSWGGEAPMAVLPPQPFAEAHPEPPAGHFERPQVVIDRLDVLIHEPMAPARGPDGTKRRSRSFRARYLRRL
jgi:hypothetical protein